MKKFLFFLFTALTANAYAQDTVRVMHYNLMYYGQTSSYCTTSNNPQAAKDSYLKKIIKYVKPDIFTANEIAPNSATHQYILDYVMNTDGVTHYNKGLMTNSSGSDLSNGMFYNADKLVLLSQHNIVTSVRDINFYNFYFKAANLATTHDTAYLTCIIAHLKAGSNASDSLARSVQTNILMNNLNSLNKKANYLLMGDFNVYTGDEQCFQNLINYSNADVRFYDPVNMVGDWNSNYYYSDYHTQSTHTTSTGCFATGGMDDRFDFILESEYIKYGTDHFQYITGSYKAIGQDGNHLNDAINYGTNNSAPDSIIEALYDMSDHLPVVLNLSLDQAVGVSELQTENYNVTFPNPVGETLHLSISSESAGQFEISIVNLLGQTVYVCSREISGGTAGIEIPVHKLKQGLYFLSVSDGKHKTITKKFIKN